MNANFIRLALALMFLLPISISSAEDPAKQPAAPDFSRDIQPIFARNCAKCHGAEEPESAFRVDVRTSLLGGGDSGEAAVIPGNSAESPLIARIDGSDEFLRMPPEGALLTKAEVATLRRWIDSGAAMPEEVVSETALVTDHWSFQPITRPEPPPAAGEWGAGAIDQFIYRELSTRKLSPSPRADRATLIRRVYLDMLGLLPSPQRAAEFVADDSPRAYEELVEEVLASPHYGERWARHWLDVARFAESNGFETNYERPGAYHYRDWVIDSLNADLPYDQFVKAQIAGDSLGHDAATGFLVGGATDSVKSPDPVLTAMQRQDELADIVNTTGTAFLGLTIGCARCHSHKFDPVLQRDYYTLQAVFAGVRHGERALPAPATPNLKQRLQELAKRRLVLRKELDEIYASQKAPQLFPPINAKLNEVNFPPVEAKFVRFTIANTNSSEPCIDELELFTATDQPQNVALAKTGAKATSSGDYLGDPNHKLEHVNDGQYGNSRSWIANSSGRGWVQIELPETVAIYRAAWGRDREEVYKDRLAIEYTLEVSLDGQQWQQVASHASHTPLGLNPVEEAAYRTRGLPTELAERVNGIAEQLKAVESESASLSVRPNAYLGTFGQPGPTHRLHRGDPMAPKEQVPPESLVVLKNQVGSLELPMNAPERERRLALAQWIASPENPLTARVMVNRLWHYHFGRGLVATPSDFGGMGFKPTHSQLLDWLASEFMEHEWSLKHIHRLILLSQTYQQSNQPRAEALAVDRDSAYLWRYPPRRLEGEALRDNILLVSGKLDRQVGGPSFMLFEPNANYARNWVAKNDFGPPEFRRMVYALKIRMEPDAVFAAFDCPDGGQIAPRRPRSTTPIQALNLFNSNFMLQQSAFFAQRVEQEAGEDPEAQIAHAFKLIYGRKPTAEEAADAQSLRKEHGLESVCRALYNTSEFLFLP